MDIENIIEFTNDEFPQETQNINTAIDMLVESLISVRNLIVNGYSQYFDAEHKDKFNLFRNKQIEIDEIIKVLNGYTNRLGSNLDDYEANIIESDEISQLIETDDNSAEQNELLKKLNINYNDQKFFVDMQKSHNLDENFTYKKPCAFEINNIKIEVFQWKKNAFKSLLLFVENR